MSFTTVANPSLSPSLGEKTSTFLTDELGNNVALMVLACANASGHLSLPASVIIDGKVSQVTNRKGSAYVVTPAGQEVPVLAVASLDSSGNLIAFKASLAALADVATLAGKLTGKFQSDELTATGSVQNVAHGLGVVPSLVLASIQDSNGVALPFAIAEGTHTTTNIVLTITASLKFKVIALV